MLLEIAITPVSEGEEKKIENLGKVWVEGGRREGKEKKERDSKLCDNGGVEREKR